MMVTLRTLHCLLKHPPAGYALFATTTGALIFALIMQYGFNFQPCILCLWQRVPFALVAFTALVAIIWKPFGRHTRFLLVICAIALFINTGLAVFHSGVERHWWLGTSGCSIEPLSGTSTESLRDELLHMAVARCDEISWTFLGLSMANYNIPFSLALAFLALIAARQTPR